MDRNKIESMLEQINIAKKEIKNNKAVSIICIVAITEEEGLDIRTYTAGYADAIKTSITAAMPLLYDSTKVEL